MIFAAADAAEPISSDKRVQGRLAAGVAVTPEYEGASDYEAVPLILGQIDTLAVRLEIEGLNARLNVRPGATFQFGPSIGYRSGRDDVSNDVVDRLSSVDDAVEAGAFARYQFRELFGQTDELDFTVEVLADLSGAHDGFTANFGSGYTTAAGERWRLGIDTEITFASEDYVQSYFGIDTRDAARSGLRVYDGGSGLKDVGLGATAGYSISDRWDFVGRVGYTRLIGDAADSPIVRREGSSNQLFSGLALSFAF